ncbi:DNA primase [Mariniplasma anaerobium]|uniref:DNA primase n=1 Tax=Mariniplasma anaerobium TaxID=2735436 RepID=A0A7U9TIT0_9MOLU|nr:DNA primase [Mariniplasma anaerobium]BCR35544.1 DNA primase [Mariniplasma anaerobium]
MDHKLIEEINEKTPIVELVSEFVTLQKTGKNFRGLCPFHQEKTPSFFVSPEKNICKCYGCGEGGAPINFYRKIKNISFDQAAEELAEKAGIKIQKTVRQKDPYESFYKLMAEAKEFYKFNLKNSQKGQEAHKYLSKREISDDIIDHFEIGYAPSHSDVLYQMLNDKGYQVSDMIKLGLVKQKDDGSYYDLFSDRLIFPITNPKGLVVGFSGRTLNPKETIKYINSPETVIFKKGQLLYHFNEALSEIRKNKQIVLYEGFFDVISSYKAGIKHGVATMGTALTIDQAKLIKQFTDSIVVAYDGDQAGQSATLKAIDLLEKVRLKTEILTIPEKMDPDEFIKAYGVEKYETLFGEYTSDPYQFKYQYFKRGKDLSNANDITAFKNNILDMLAYADPSIQNIYKNRLAADLKVSPDAFEIKVRKQPTLPHKESLPEKQRTRISNKYEKAERYLIYAMLRSRIDANHIQARLKMSDFVDQVQSTIRLLIDSYYKDHQELDVEEFVDGLNNEQREYAENTLFKDILWERNETIDSIEFDHYITLVKQANYMRRKVYVRAQLEKEEYKNPILMEELTILTKMK